MMRRWLRLLLAAAAAAERTVNMAGVVEVDAWMHHRAPPPRRWDATDPAALGAKWTKLSSGFYKEVHRATLGGDDVVVKRRKLYKADRKRAGGAALRGEALYHEREVRGEVLYLEYVRGLPGVPRLRGAWLDANGTRVTYAVDRAGQESEIPNFKASYLGRFPLVSADFWTSDHLSERSRRVDVFSGTRAHGTLTLKRR